LIFKSFTWKFYKVINYFWDEEISSLTEPVPKFVGKMTRSSRKQFHSYPGVPETFVCEHQGDTGDEPV
jgi:hypothetical protein